MSPSLSFFFSAQLFLQGQRCVMLSVTQLCVFPVQKSVFNNVRTDNVLLPCGAGWGWGGVEAHHHVPPHTLPSERDEGVGGRTGSTVLECLYSSGDVWTKCVGL